METGILVTIIVTLLGVIGAVLTTQGNRLRQVENQLGYIQEDNRRLWWWGRQLVDYAYRHRAPGSPELPKPPSLKGDMKENV